MKKQAGFTMLELVAVIITVAILAAVSTDKFQNASSVAKTRGSELAAEGVNTAWEAFVGIHGPSAAGDRTKTYPTVGGLVGYAAAVAATPATATPKVEYAWDDFTIGGWTPMPEIYNTSPLSNGVIMGSGTQSAQAIGVPCDGPTMLANYTNSLVGKPGQKFTNAGTATMLPGLDIVSVSATMIGSRITAPTDAVPLCRVTANMMSPSGYWAITKTAPGQTHSTYPISGLWSSAAGIWTGGGWTHAAPWKYRVSCKSYNTGSATYQLSGITGIGMCGQTDASCWTGINARVVGQKVSTLYNQVSSPKNPGVCTTTTPVGGSPEKEGTPKVADDFSGYCVGKGLKIRTYKDEGRTQPTAAETDLVGSLDSGNVVADATNCP